MRAQKASVELAEIERCAMLALCTHAPGGVRLLQRCHASPPSHCFLPCRYEQYNERHGAKLASSAEEAAAEEDDW